ELGQIDKIVIQRLLNRAVYLPGLRFDTASAEQGNLPPWAQIRYDVC
ncbi:21126_t:CDS:1, partial [Dentiscutata erythropus]